MRQWEERLDVLALGGVLALTGYRGVAVGAFLELGQLQLYQLCFLMQAPNRIKQLVSFCWRNAWLN